MKGRPVVALTVIIACAMSGALNAQERPTMILPPSGGVIRPAPASPPQAVRPAARPTQPSAPRPVAPKPEGPKPPVPITFEKPMLELSEAIGSLAFLTALCSPTTQPNPWLRRMEGLLDSEGEAAGNKDKMIGAYNQGYAAFSTAYRQCSEAAQAARGLLVQDATRLARELDRRFGG